MTFSNKDKPIFNGIRDKLIDLPLWCAIDISFMKLRYEIIHVCEQIIIEDAFKELGFQIKIIDDMNFIQKLPYFYGNLEFVKKHSLYFNDKPCYTSYLRFMSTK